MPWRISDDSAPIYNQAVPIVAFVAEVQRVLKVLRSSSAKLRAFRWRSDEVESPFHRVSASTLEEEIILYLCVERGLSNYVSLQLSQNPHAFDTLMGFPSMFPALFRVWRLSAPPDNFETQLNAPRIGHAIILRALLKRGADPNAEFAHDLGIPRCRSDPSTPWVQFLEAASRQSWLHPKRQQPDEIFTQVITSLIQGGADLDAQIIIKDDNVLADSVLCGLDKLPGSDGYVVGAADLAVLLCHEDDRDKVRHAIAEARRSWLPKVLLKLWRAFLAAVAYVFQSVSWRTNSAIALKGSAKMKKHQ